MQLIWKGQSCFQISANGKDSQVILVIDPFGPDLGLRVPEFAADILLLTHNHSDHNNKEAVKGVSGSSRPFLIDGPGEYEVKGVYIQGIPSFHDNSFGKEKGLNTIYSFEIEEVRICHLGDLGQKELFPEQIEDIGEVDILLVPVGGTYTLDAEKASKVISQLEPRIVIPMHYQLPKLRTKLDSVEKFLKTMGKKSVQPLPKLTIKKKDLLSEETKIVVLES